MKIDFSNTPEQNKTLLYRSLEDCFATNVITVDEYENRIEQLISATDNVSIAAIAEALPLPAVRTTPEPEGGFSAAENRATDTSARRRFRSHETNAGISPWEGKETSTVFSFFGGAARKGKWHVPRILFLFTVFGGNDLDFTNAVFPDGNVQIVSFSLFGGNTVKITGDRRDIPKINITSLSIFGATEIRAKKTGYLPEDGIHVSALSVFGGFDAQVPNTSGVHSSGVGIFGAVPNIDIAPESEESGFIDIKSVAFFGGATVKNAAGKKL